jgi:hypothetical protein
MVGLTLNTLFDFYGLSWRASTCTEYAVQVLVLEYLSGLSFSEYEYCTVYTGRPYGALWSCTSPNTDLRYRLLDKHCQSEMDTNK